MREYKFRAWNKNTKKMYKIGQITLEKGSWNYEPDNREYIGMSIPYQPSFILMQYTGLKDKNGQEIYEGDILLAPEWFGKLKCVCIYQQENTVNPIQGFGLYSYDTYFQKYNTLVESDEWDEFEVKGNIYDNPELLEEGE